MTSTLTVHLLGGSEKESEAWVQALRSVLRRPSETRHHHVQSPSSPSLSGWAFMVGLPLSPCGVSHLSLSPHSRKTEPRRRDGASSTPLALSPSPRSRNLRWVWQCTVGVVKTQATCVWLILTSFSLSLALQPLQRVNVAMSTVRKVRDSLLMDSKHSSTSLSSQLAIQEDGDQSPVLLIPCNVEEKVERVSVCVRERERETCW